MPQKLSEEEEVAALVSNLLEDGRDNPFFGIILEIVQTYNELSPASQKVLQEASKKLVENLSKKKEPINCNYSQVYGSVSYMFGAWKICCFLDKIGNCSVINHQASVHYHSILRT